MQNVEIKTRDYPAEMHRRGFPYRVAGGDFPLKKACKTFELGANNVVGPRTQEEQYRIAVNDDPGWLMYIMSESSLDAAKHIAGNIMHRYIKDELGTLWIKKIDGFKWKPEINLFIFDALFEDDTAYRRSMFYDAIMAVDSPNISVIVLGRTDDPIRFIRHIGLRPNLTIYTK